MDGDGIMTSIDNLLGIAQQFSTASTTIKTAGKLVKENAELIAQQKSLADKTFFKQPERQAELLAAADAKLGTAVELGNEAISQVRQAIASLRDDGDAIASHKTLADQAEAYLTGNLTYAIRAHPNMAHGEAFARSTDWSSNYRTLTSILDDTSARLEAEHVVQTGRLG